MTNHYEDIMSLPYPFPTNRKRMSLAERASQFAPFAALSGFSEAITSAAKEPQSSPNNDILSEDFDLFPD